VSKRMLIIITRMYAERGKCGEDEFCDNEHYSTESDHSVWHQDCNKKHAVFPQQVDQNTEQAVVVIHGYKGYKERYPKGNPQKVVCSIKQAIKDSNLELCNFEEIGILCHPDPYWNNFYQTFPIAGKKIHNNIAWVKSYSSRGPNGLCLIRNLANKAISNQSFSDEFDKVWNFFAQMPSTEMSEAIRWLSALKHRIARLFLSIDIDLQGIQEDDVNLKQLLENKDHVYYRQKLADLHYLLVGDRVKEPACGTEVAPCGYVKKTEGLQPENSKALYDVIEEKLESESNTTERWNRVIQLAGLTKCDDNFTPDLNSPIFRFMCLLDCKIGKQIKCQDVKDLLNFSWHDRDQKGIWGKINSFHDWFEELDRSIDELREIAMPNKGDRQI